MFVLPSKTPLKMAFQASGWICPFSKMSSVILKKRNREKEAEQKWEYWKDPEFMEKERKRDNKRKEVEEEEVRKKPKWKKMLPNCKVLMDPEVLPKLIPYSNEEFQALVGEFSDVIHNTTWCGTFRKNAGTLDVPALEFLFFTLFWLRNYPTLTLLSGLFHLHECTCTQTLKCITIAMASVLQGEIAWPSDEEFEQLTFFTYSNGSFEEIVCIADRTEIEISCLSDPAIQRCTWSGKKK